MALALIYIFATAKPFSIRRLAAFFGVALILATPALQVFRVGNAQSNALIIAASLTLLVWSIPLFRLLRDSICRRSLTLDAFRHVSEFVQWTYAFGLVALLTIVAAVILDGAGPVTAGELMRLLAGACLIALVVQIGLSFLRGKKGQS